MLWYLGESNYSKLFRVMWKTIAYIVRPKKGSAAGTAVGGGTAVAGSQQLVALTETSDVSIGHSIHATGGQAQHVLFHQPLAQRGVPMIPEVCAQCVVLVRSTMHSVS